MDLTEKWKGVNGRLIFAIAASTIGSAFQHGYNTGVINIPERVIVKFINGTNSKSVPISALQFQYSLMVSMFCLGGMVGPMLIYFLSHRLGRKGALLFNCLLVFVAAALMGFAKKVDNYGMLVLGRFVIGINAGLSSGLVPMYLSEICPVAVRGAVGTVYQLVLVISILISQILGLPYLLGSEKLWPILFGIIIIPTIFMMVALPMCPESPKFVLIIREDPEVAEEIIKWLRKTDDIENELRVIKHENTERKRLPKISLVNFSEDPVLRRALTMAIVVMLAQQFSGINAVIYYSTTILTISGVAQKEAVYATLFMGLINVLATIASLFLVEVAGRKILLVFSMAGVMTTAVVLTATLAVTVKYIMIAYINMIVIAKFVVLFAVGLGPIPWFLVAELFEQAPRPLATSLAASINWFANFIVSVALLPIVNVIGGYVFLIFAALTLIFLVYTFLEIPETKNRTIEEIKAAILEKCVK